MICKAPFLLSFLFVLAACGSAVPEPTSQNRRSAEGRSGQAADANPNHDEPKAAKPGKKQQPPAPKVEDTTEPPPPSPPAPPPLPDSKLGWDAETFRGDNVMNLIPVE